MFVVIVLWYCSDVLLFYYTVYSDFSGRGGEDCIIMFFWLIFCDCIIVCSDWFVVIFSYCLFWRVWCDYIILFVLMCLLWPYYDVVTCFMWLYYCLFFILCCNCIILFAQTCLLRFYCCYCCCLTCLLWRYNNIVLTHFVWLLLLCYLIVITVAYSC